MDWIRVYELLEGDREWKIEEAMDAVFQGLDELFRVGKFDEADKAIQACDLERLDVQLISGVLAASFVAKDKLPSRPELVKRANERFMKLAPDRIDGLMRGLE